MTGRHPPRGRRGMARGANRPAVLLDAAGARSVPLWPGQETLEKARQEDRTRTKLLAATVRVASPAQHPRRRIHRRDRLTGRERWGAIKLARHLAKRSRANRASAGLASSRNMREVRTTVIGALLEALAGYDDRELRVVTVISRAWDVPTRELGTVKAATIKNQFRTHLQRAGVLAAPGFLIAFLHGDHEPTSGRFQLHFHMVTTADKAALLMNLKKQPGYVKTRTGSPPIRRQQIKNRATQLSYLLKAYWPEKPIFDLDGKTRRRRVALRVKRAAHTRVMLWLQANELADLMMLNHALFRGKRFYL